MVRHVYRSVTLLVAVGVAVAWLAQAAQQGPHPIVRLAKKLAEPVDFPGLDDPRTTLQDALGILADRHGLRFDVNEKAFLMEVAGAAAQAPRGAGHDAFVSVADDQAGPGGKATPLPGGSGGGLKPGGPGGGLPGGPGGGPTGPGGGLPGGPQGAPPGKAAPPGKNSPPGKVAPPNPPAANAVSDLMNSPVAATQPIPKLNDVRLETVLKRILARVPSQSGVTYVLRRDGIEITTTEAKLAEFRVLSDHAPLLPPGLDGGPPRDVPPLDLTLVQAEFDKRPLEQALKELADTTDSTVILDGRAAEKAKAVTATLINVPVDTAVEILANMSGLQVVTRDRVLYVTTKDNADAMQKQVRDRLGVGQIGMPGFGGQPGGFGPGGLGQPMGPGFGPGGGPGPQQLIPGPPSGLGGPIGGADKGKL